MSTRQKLLDRAESVQRAQQQIRNTVCLHYTYYWRALIETAADQGRHSVELAVFDSPNDMPIIIKWLEDVHQLTAVYRSPGRLEISWRARSN